VWPIGRNWWDMALRCEALRGEALRCEAVRCAA
jgi:hypothetical protein